MRQTLRPAVKRFGETVRNPKKYTLGTAALATGKAKSTILRAIKSGTISANKGDDGSYSIDPSELHRVFDATGEKTLHKNDKQPKTEPLEALVFKLEILEKEREREREQLQETIADLRSRLDRSEARITSLLAAPIHKRKWWPW